MIVPLRKDEDFLADVAAADDRHLHLWWLGQSGFLVQHGAFRMIFDPYLSDSLTRKYADTDKPHVRMTERVVDPARLTGIELATSTHAHTDHLDAETLAALRKSNPAMKLVHPAAIGAVVAERVVGLGDDGVAMDAGEIRRFDTHEIHAVAAAHNTVERDEQGRCKFLGYVLKVGGFTIFHSGDTLWHDELVPSLAQHRIDLALLPINGNKPERRVAGNLDGREAAELAHRIGARCVVPCHYEMFEFNTASPDLFKASCESLGQTYQLMRAGERLSMGVAEHST